MARRMGIHDGVVFHKAAVESKPAEMSERDDIYDVSIATDHALVLGRDRCCARVPMGRAGMAAIVDDLNGLNAPYRSGTKNFEWDVPRNNCAHLVDNALAAIGLSEEWQTARPILIAAFDFPVPKNEFVNLMRHTNDMNLADPASLYDDAPTRDAVLRGSRIATAPGALAEAERAMSRNHRSAADVLRRADSLRPLRGMVRPDLRRASLHRSAREPRSFRVALRRHPRGARGSGRCTGSVARAGDVHARLSPLRRAPENIRRPLARRAAACAELRENVFTTKGTKDTKKSCDAKRDRTTSCSSCLGVQTLFF
jgi:hypothetical protein